MTGSRSFTAALLLLFAASAPLTTAGPARADELGEAMRAYANMDFVGSFSIYSELASVGNVTAELELGVQYNYGEGVPQNFAEALYWYQKAADQGSGAANYRIAWLYFRGQGVLRSFRDGAKWMQTAADLGYTDAMEFIGDCYDNGCWDEDDKLVVAQDKKKAAYWYGTAAALGNRRAEEILGK